MSSLLHPLQPPSNCRLLDQSISNLDKCSDPRRLVQIHSQIFRLHLHTDPFIASKLVASYSICLLPSFPSVFDFVPNPSSHLFNNLIRAFAHNSLPSLSFAAFSRMQLSTAKADQFTYQFLLKSISGCSHATQLIHAHVIKLGFLSDLFIPNSIIDSYSKSGDVRSACKVFDDLPFRGLVSWNSMVAAFVRAGELRDARQLFDKMPVRDAVSWNSLLDGYVKAGEIDVAFDLFSRIPVRNVMSWSIILSGYCNKGDMEMARMLFDTMPDKNVISWTIMITGYAEKGLSNEASALIDQMKKAGLEFDAGAATSILRACAESGLLQLGIRVHDIAKKRKLIRNAQIKSALVHMYSNCGAIDEAWAVFDETEEKNLVLWNCMIQGLAMHGHSKSSLELFAKMEAEGIKPDGITFIGVLCACTRIDLIKEARSYFVSMQKDYKISPTIEHYGCLINILGRGGLLQEAYNLAKSMPFEPNAIVWRSIFNACMAHNNADFAEKIVDELMSLEPSDAENYAIISKIYVSTMKKLAGLNLGGPTCFKPDGTIHELSGDDSMNLLEDGILRILNRLKSRVKQIRYVA